MKLSLKLVNFDQRNTKSRDNEVGEEIDSSKVKGGGKVCTLLRTDEPVLWPPTFRTALLPPSPPLENLPYAMPRAALA